MAQQLEAEGKEETKESTNVKYCDYQTTFKAMDDSLYIMIKNKKTKRSFSKIFSKSELIAMHFRQSVDKIVNLIRVARSASNKKWIFEIRFGSSDNDKVSKNNLNCDYNKGDAMFMIIAINEDWFSDEYMFKLPEQKRSETDILRDIIDDLREEISELKKRPKPQTGIVKYKSSGNTKTNPTTWDIEEIAPTLPEMVQREDNNKTIVIIMKGMYRVTLRRNHMETCNAAVSTTHSFSLNINGTTIAKCYGTIYGHCNISEIFNFNAGDKLTAANDNCKHNYSKINNCFILEKLQ
eukprot:1855_1